MRITNTNSVCFTHMSFDKEIVNDRKLPSIEVHIMDWKE